MVILSSSAFAVQLVDATGVQAGSVTTIAGDIVKSCGSGLSERTFRLVI